MISDLFYSLAHSPVRVYLSVLPRLLLFWSPCVKVALRGDMMILKNLLNLLNAFSFIPKKSHKINSGNIKCIVKIVCVHIIIAGDIRK